MTWPVDEQLPASLSSWNFGMFSSCCCCPRHANKRFLGGFFVALCFEQFVVFRGRDAVHVFWYGACAHKRSFSSGVDINLGPNVASPGERYKLRHRSINRLEPSCLRFKIPRHPRRRITGRSRGEGKNCLVTDTPPLRFLSLSLSWRPRAL